MNKQIKYYVISSLITLAFYVVSTFVGSAINVLISFASCFSQYSEFLESANASSLILVFAFAIINHIFFAWLTVKILSKYKKTDFRMESWLFRISAIVVVAYALIVAPLIFSTQPGWFSWLSHSIAIVLFGRSAIKKFQLNTTNTNAQINYSNSNIARSQTETQFCCFCGEKLFSGAEYCHKCGKQVFRG